jgi:hypothetical protein
MDNMTPEERFTQIENLLKLTAEHLAEHEERFRKHEDWYQKHEDWFRKHEEAAARRDAEIDKHNAAIRDLIVLSRFSLEETRKTQASIAELREAQKITEEKLHILVDTVDRIIRNSGK